MLFRKTMAHPSDHRDENRKALLFSICMLLVWMPTAETSTANLNDASRTIDAERIITTLHHDKITANSFPTVGTITDDRYAAPPPPPDCSDDGNKKKSTSNRLECWLWKLQIPIPSQSFKKDYIKIKIDHMSCTEFQMVDLHSSYVPSKQLNLSHSNSIPPKLGLKAKGLSATCHGKYASTGLSGKVRASVVTEEKKDGLVMQLQVLSSPSSKNQVNNDPDKDPVLSIAMPRSVQTVSCDTHLRVPRHGVKFSGSISAHVIDLFSGSIAGYITDALSSDQLCPLATQYVDPTVTHYLEEADKYLSQYLPNYRRQPQQTEEQQRGQSHSPPWTTTTSTSNIRQRMAKQVTGPDAWSGRTFLDERLLPIASNDTTASTPGALPVVRVLLTTANQLLGKYLNHGLINWDSQVRHVQPKEGTLCDEEDDCGYFFNGFAGIFRSITGGNITIVAPRMLRNLTFALPYGATGHLNIDHLKFSGLDQVDSLRLMDPTSTSDSTVDNGSPVDVLYSSLTSEMGWTVSTKVRLKVEPAPKPNEDDVLIPQPLEESFQLTLNISNIHANANAYIKVQEWNTTSLLSVARAIQDIADGVNKTRSIRCLVSTIQTMELLEPDMVAKAIFESVTVAPRDDTDLDTISALPLQVTSSLAAGIDEIANSAFELLLREYPFFVTTVAEGLLKGPGRRYVNQYVKDLIEKWGRNKDGIYEDGDISAPMDRSVCPSHLPSERPEWVNFTKVQLLNTINRFLDRKETLRSINGYLECLSKMLVKGQEEKLVSIAARKQEEEMDSTRPFWVRLRELNLNHVNSVEKLEFLLPASPDEDDSTYLQTSIAWGSPTDDHDSPPQAFISLELSYPAFNMSAIVNVTAFLGDVEVVIGTRVDYDINKLSNISVTDILSHGQCAAVPAAEVRFVPSSSFTMGRIGMNVSALVTTSSDRDIPFVLSTDFYPWVQEYLDWSWDSARDLSNKLLEKLVVRALDLCEGVVPGYVEPEDGEGAESGSSLLSSIPKWIRWTVGVLFGLLQIGIIWLSAHSSWPDQDHSDLQQSREADFPAAPDPRDDVGESSSLVGQLLEEDILEPSLDDAQAELDQQVLNDVIERSLEEDRPSTPLTMETARGKSLFLDSTNMGGDVVVRHLVPVFVVGTIALLVSSNLSTGATVDLELSLGGGESNIPLRTLSVPSLFSFSLFNTAYKLAKAGSYPLFILVVGFSGLWPYAKLILMMNAWFIRTSNPKRRERFLLMLDALGKFSLVDTYVLVVMMVAFRYHVDLGDMPNVFLDVYVTPHYGFFGFLIATSLSLVLGHLMVHFHRRSQSRYTSETTEKESLFDHEFDVQENEPRRRLSRLLQVILFTGSLLAVVLLALGFSKRSFSFEFGGLAGIALEDRRSTSYSLISLGFSIPRSVKDGSNVGIHLLQIAYYFYAVVTPLACLVLIIILQLIPLTVDVQHSVLVMAEIANAWSAVEVFVLSIVAALLQLSTFTAFIVGNHCNQINSLLRDHFNDEIPPSDAVCYTVHASVGRDCWYLGAGVLLNSFVVSVILRFARCAVDERTSRFGLIEQLSASHEVGDALPINDTPLVKSSIARTMFRFPLKSLFFGEAMYYPVNIPAEQAAEEQEEEEEGEVGEDLPEWRHWF